jgi:hypothetical protein
VSQEHLCAGDGVGRRVQEPEEAAEAEEEAEDVKTHGRR